MEIFAEDRRKHGENVNLDKGTIKRKRIVEILKAVDDVELSGKSTKQWVTSGMTGKTTKQWRMPEMSGRTTNQWMGERWRRIGAVIRKPE